MNLFSGKKNILWDFDGVLIDSSEIREKGFTEVLSAFPEDQVQELLKYHRKNGGLSRYVKFRYFFETLRNKKIPEQELNTYAESFSEIMRMELTHKKFLIPDTLNFLQEHHRNFEMHLISGSDGEELRFLARTLEVEHFFKTIEGSPTPKVELLRHLMAKYGYVPSETCYIGDAINDFDAAEANGISFFGYNNVELRDLGSGYINSFQ